MVRLFQDGEKVVHLSKGKAGKVITFIGGEDQRYYIEHSGYTWSVPERGLDSKKAILAPNDNKTLQAGPSVKSAILSSE